MPNCTSILDKLVKIPAIVKQADSGPLSKDDEPLLTFRNTIKPFRDSIVHASPFSAPEQFGGYDKLSKIYDLQTETVEYTLEMVIEIIHLIQSFITGQSFPGWMLKRSADGRFEIDEP